MNSVDSVEQFLQNSAAFCWNIPLGKFFGSIRLEEALEILAPAFQYLTLKELSLTMTASNNSTPEAVLTKLFTPECNWSILEKFSLDFHGNISDVHIKNILEQTVNSLKVFKLITHTNDLSKEICLKSELSKMKVLETIYIEDAKEISAKDLKESRKLYSEAQKQEKSDAIPVVCNHTNLSQSVSTRNKIESDFCTEFLLSLPASTKELSLCGIIRDKNFEEKLDKLENINETFLNLISLEIRGPCLSNHGLHIGQLILQMKKLKSLTLSDCDLTDAHLTGLSAESARTMRKCGTYMLAFNNYMDACNDTVGTDILQDADALKNLSFPGFNNSSAEEKGFRFAEMTDLKHLDLSFNHGISDVTIFCSLQIPHLESLSLESCPKITDSGLEFIPFYLKNVEEINLRSCRLVSKHGLNRLVRFCPTIKRILTTKVIQNNDYSIDIPQLSSDFNAVVCLTYK